MLALKYYIKSVLLGSLICVLLSTTVISVQWILNFTLLGDVISFIIGIIVLLLLLFIFEKNDNLTKWLSK